MRGSRNQIRVLVQRFVALPPVVRMAITKRLLELYGAEQALREAGESRSIGARPPKSFVEEFWDEVEHAHNDRPGTVNPFAEESRAGGGGGGGFKSAPEIDGAGGFFSWRKHPSELLALL